MPIDIDTFEHESTFEGTGESNARRILGFLARNDDKAWTRAEIADETDLDPNVVSSVLNRLKQRNLVRHKSPYWALGDEQRVRAAYDFSDALAALDEQLGEEDMEMWRENAPDEHPSQRGDSDEE